ncbi:MAG: hypothetical protein V4569_14285 [Pseudomonadota bacterium]
MLEAKPPRRLAPVAVLAALALLAGCATFAPGGLPPGTRIATARAAAFGPSGEYALPGGGTRLEFAQGAFGKQTYMLDFDKSGVLVSSQQVLTELNLATIAPGMSANELRAGFGRPAWVFGVQHPRAHIWNYRFDGGDCVWYQVTVLDDTQTVASAGIGTDPACDGPSQRD